MMHNGFCSNHGVVIKYGEVTVRGTAIKHAHGGMLVEDRVEGRTRGGQGQEEQDKERKLSMHVVFLCLTVINVRDLTSPNYFFEILEWLLLTIVLCNIEMVYILYLLYCVLVLSPPSFSQYPQHNNPTNNNVITV